MCCAKARWPLPPSCCAMINGVSPGQSQRGLVSRRLPRRSLAKRSCERFEPPCMSPLTNGALLLPNVVAAGPPSREVSASNLVSRMRRQKADRRPSQHLSKCGGLVMNNSSHKTRPPRCHVERQLARCCVRGEGVVNALGKEVLQPSGLHRFSWPANDPQAIHQQTRRLGVEDHFLIREAGQAFHFNKDSFAEQTARYDTAAKLHHLLTCRAINFNGVHRVRGERIWLDRIRAAVERSEPVQLAYPLMCKMPNPAKQMTSFGITAGEEATVRFFQRIGELAKELYEPGIKINVVSDAVLYNVALQNPPPTAINFIEELRDLVLRLDETDTVVVHDYVELLVPYARQYQRAYEWFYKRLGQEDRSLITTAKHSSLAASVKASLNTSRLGLGYQDQKEIFGPEQRPANAHYKMVEQMAEFGLREQIAIKMACDRLNVFEHIWPRHVRVSCHRGIKHGHAVIGLRPYPTYYSSSKLLPYHGVALIKKDLRGVAKLVVRPEFLLRGNPDLLRVENALGETYLYRAC